MGAQAGDGAEQGQEAGAAGVTSPEGPWPGKTQSACARLLKMTVEGHSMSQNILNLAIGFCLYLGWDLKCK